MDGLRAQCLVEGLLKLARRRRELSLVAKRIVAGGACAALLLCSLLDASLPASARMRKHAAVGRWIREHAAADPALAGNINRFSLDAFYAQGKPIGVVLPRDCLLPSLPDVLVGRQADFLVLWNQGDLGRDHLAMIQQRITACCDYRRVPADELPAGEDEVLVFVRR